jgi:hypothetical protein
MDFITQLLRIVWGKIAIIVIVDRLSKQYYLIVIRDKVILVEIVKLFMKRIYSQYVIPRSIMLNRDLKFTV